MSTEIVLLITFVTQTIVNRTENILDLICTWYIIIYTHNYTIYIQGNLISEVISRVDVLIYSTMKKLR